mgnify:CR=1 FL=1
MNAILKKKFFRRKEQAEIQSLNQKLTEPAFLIKKDWVIATVKYKLKLIDLNLSDTYNRKIMQKVEYRVKKADSIARKLIKKGYPVTYENAKNALEKEGFFMKASGASVYYGNTTTAESQSIAGGVAAVTGTVIDVKFFNVVEDGYTG